MIIVSDSITGESIESISLEVWDQKEYGFNWITGVTINTTNGSLSIRVNSNLDELVIQSPTDSKFLSQNDQVVKVIGVDDLPALRDLANKKVVWLWTLTNSQGYLDGFQIEVANGSDPILIQLVAAGSRIEINKVIRS